MATQINNNDLINLLDIQFVRKRLPITVYDPVNLAGFGEYAYSSVGTTAIVIIPDGSYDVRELVRYTAVVSEMTDTGVNSATGQLAPGATAAIYTDGVDTCTLRCNADGSLDVRSTAGAQAFRVKLRLDWL